MKNNVIPSVTLTITCIVSSLFIVLAHELTKENIAIQKAKRLNTSIESLFGNTESTVIENNFGEDKIQAIYVTPDGKTAVHVLADGYSKFGINVIVGIDKYGSVCGIEFVSLGETPGIGSKVRDIPDFREQFYGQTDTDVPLDAVSGATFSSKGMKSAVDAALKVYVENKEAILHVKK